MDEKSPEKGIDEAMQSEEIGSDEAISASESPVITTESTNEDSEKDNKFATSQIQSNTSVIDISSGSTSVSEISCEKTKSVVTQEKQSDSRLHNERTETELLKSATELPYEEGSVSVANERTEPPVESSRPSVADIPSTVAVQSPLPIESYMAVSKMGSLSRPSDVPCEQEASCTEENKAASTETSPKGIIGRTIDGIKSFMSPSKSKAKKSPLKSMSPSKKCKLNREEESTSAPKVPISAEGKDNVTNENESFLKGIFSKRKNKPVDCEKTEQSISKTEASTEIKQPKTNERRWLDDRSPTEISLEETIMTDLPSTSSSSDDFSAQSSRKQSAAGENECEAVASDFSDSAEVLDSNINENNNTNESQTNSLSNEEGQESASDNIDQQQVPSKEKSMKD